MLECVPNISAGKNEILIQELSQFLSNASGCKLYHVDSHVSVNRSVFTYFVSEQAFLEINSDFFKIALNGIDMANQKGLHPRIGAVDVFPIVAVGNTSKETALKLTRKLAKKVSRNFKLPIYLYENSQIQEHRKRLEQIRKGGYEFIAEKMLKPKWKPDYGPKKLNPHTGATVMGVRNILLAINFGLKETNLETAKTIAKKVRSSGYLLAGQRMPGLLPHVKSIGWMIPEYKLVQVSVNITAYKSTGLYEVFTTLNTLAKQYDTEIIKTELIGVLPKDALIDAGKKFYPKETDNEALIKLAIAALKLDNELNENIERRLVDFTSLAQIHK